MHPKSLDLVGADDGGGEGERDAQLSHARQHHRVVVG